VVNSFVDLLEASGFSRIKELEARHSKLKRMYAELKLGNAAMKDLIANIV